MITLLDIEEARRIIQDAICKTPLIRSRFLSEICKGDAYLKLENLQETGSFKIRGALNKIRNLSPQEIQRGIIAASSGNHAQAVAVCADKLRLRAVVVIPNTTPKVKVDKIRKHNVNLILHGGFYDVAEQYARELAEKEGMTYVSPYNDPFVIAGQGTVGLEILEDLADVDSIIVPVSGGSLIAGIAIAAKSKNPHVRILGVQPEATPAMYYSLKAGKITTVEMKETVADGLVGNLQEGSITFELVQKYVDKILLYDEQTIKKGIVLLWKKERQIVEGAGAISIAPILESKEQFTGKKTVAVVSGGNIDEAIFREAISSEEYDKS